MSNIDHEGFDPDGLWKAWNPDGYDTDGFDRDGIDRQGYGPDGFNAYGTDREGYDRSGFGGAGRNRQGQTRLDLLPIEEAFPIGRTVAIVCWGGSVQLSICSTEASVIGYATYRGAERVKIRLHAQDYVGQVRHVSRAYIRPVKNTR